MFSTIQLRIISAKHNNPTNFKHVTMMVDGHDTRASYSAENNASMYSYKLKKSGLRTQVCMDINGIVLIVSPSMPCKDNNDGTMLLEMGIEHKVHRLDCIALDGGYTQYVSKVNVLSSQNFCTPIRKLNNIDMSASDVMYNNIFGSFRSKVKTKFAELVNIFQRFDSSKSIRINNINIFELQLQLFLLLLNIKCFI